MNKTLNEMTKEDRKELFRKAIQKEINKHHTISKEVVESYGFILPQGYKLDDNDHYVFYG